MTVRLLMGPQRPDRYLGSALESSSVPDGPMAVITAGWQEAEEDIDELRELVGRPLENLRLWSRTEDVFLDVPGLRELYRERQDRLIQLQRLYRLRLKHLAASTRQILRAKGDASLVVPEQRHAIAQIRALDRHQLQRAEAIHREFDPRIRELGGAALERQSKAVANTLERHASILIGGGNVIILQNRMRLFGLAQALRDHAIVAWSAGAMILADRVVLYHDNTPEGPRNAEVVGAGFGAMPGYVFFPNTMVRLRSGDASRVQLLARRFEPDVCVALNNRTVLEHDGQRVVRCVETRRLGPEGVLEELNAR